MSGREMAGALADVMKQQADKAQTLKEADAERKKGRKTSPITWVLFFAFSALSVYIWIGSPEWLESGPAEVPPALANAGLRMEVYQQAILIENFFEDSGSLPSDLTELGTAQTSVVYTRIDAETYRLELDTPLGSVEYDSREPLDRFLGNSLQTIRLGG